MFDLTMLAPCSVVDVASLITSPIRESFDVLARDDYHPDGTRLRRFSQFRLTHARGHAELRPLSPRPFTQRLDNNGLVGNTLRYFPPIRSAVEPFVLAGFAHAGLSGERDWQVNCHQMRVFARPGASGRAAPEGVHRDGVDRVFMACIARRNIAGGATRIFGPDKRLLLEREIAAGEAMLIDDSAVFHDVSPFTPREESRAGYRDMFIIAFMPWSEGRYGPDYEISVTGKAASEAQIEEVAWK